MTNFKIFYSQIYDPDILETYAKLISYPDTREGRSAKATIRRAELEPEILKYYNKFRSENMQFRPGAGPEPDLVATDWDIDIKAKEAAIEKTGLGITIGGAGIQFTSLIQALREQKEDVNKLLRLAGTKTLNIRDQESLITRAVARGKLPGFQALRTQSDRLTGIITESGQAIVKGKDKKLWADLLKSRPEFSFETTEESLTEVARVLQKKSTDDLISFLETKQPKAYANLKRKSKNVLIMYPEVSGGTNTSISVNSLKVAQLSFEGDNYFTGKTFDIKVRARSSSSITFYPYVKSSIESKIIQDLSEITQKLGQLPIVDSFSRFEKDLQSFESKKESAKLEGLTCVTKTAILGQGTPGSIPQGAVQAIARRKSSAFTSRKASIRSILRETREATTSIGDFVTDEQITALVKREMLRRMPIGPVGGPPLSPRVLTYRTGRFVNSTQVFADIERKQIQYFYNPIYSVHEKTSRDPRNLMRASISSVALVLFKRRFNIVKTSQEGKDGY